MTRILGIETSCDETAAAVVDDGRIVRSNIIASQHDLHERYGGVVPELASRAHVEKIVPVIEQALAAADTNFDSIDAIAVGNRPGLIGSLLVGVSAAQSLAWSLGKPLIGVDHVRAHLYAATMPSTGQPAASPPDFPALGLVVSGGHTTLYSLSSPTQLTRLGSTIDDAVGEAYDKAAVILEAGYPGGPAIDKRAQSGDPAAVDRLPRSMLGPDNLDFSFSGLKTALLYATRGHPQGRGKSAAFPRSASDLSDAHRANLAAAFQDAAIDAVIKKLKRAIQHMLAAGSPPRALLIGGGVSANSLLRKRTTDLAWQHQLDLRLPPLDLCMDNAAMIAGLGFEQFQAGETADLDLPAIATTQT